MPMDKYAIYTYKLTSKPINNNGVLPMQTLSSVENLSLAQRFESLFSKERGGELPVQRIKKNNTADKYPCRVLNHDSNVILLRLVKEMDKDIWEELPTNNPVPKIEKTKKKSKPYCYIIIDTRPNVQIISIQSNSDAWKNTNDVKEILQESFNDLLKQRECGVEVNILSKMLPSKFWEYVDKKRHKDKVSIKSMVFSFANHKRRPDIDIKQALSSEWKHFESFIGWIDQLGGDKGEIRILPPKNDALMKRKLADIKHMVEICSNSNYALSVTFTDDITYKCNQELRAELPMKNEQIRREFELGMHDLFGSYKLLVWLDDVKEKIEGYKDVEDSKSKLAGKTQKKVS